MELNYEADTAIDKYRLDVEWEKQSTLVFDYSKESAHKNNEWLTEKDMYNILRAEAELKIRKGEVVLKAEDGKVIKLNNDIVKAYLDCDEGLKAQNKKTLQAKYAYDIAEAAVQSLEHKKRALTYLADLFKLNMYSAPTEANNQGDLLNKKFN